MVVVVGADSDPSGDLSKPKPVLEVVESYSEPVKGEGVKILSETIREEGGKLTCPHKESATLVGRKSACARLTLESLCTVGRCYPRGRNEAEHKRQARKESHQSYFEMC